MFIANDSDEMNWYFGKRAGREIILPEIKMIVKSHENKWIHLTWTGAFRNMEF
jgi:hypothetical protein